jgi:hypothetical protein
MKSLIYYKEGDKFKNIVPHYSKEYDVDGITYTFECIDKPMWKLNNNILEKNTPFEKINLFTKKNGILYTVDYYIYDYKVYFECTGDNIILYEDNKVYTFNIPKPIKNVIDYYIKAYYKNNVVFFDIELNTILNYDYTINITGEINKSIILQAYTKHISFKHNIIIQLEKDFNLFFNGVNKLVNVINIDIFPTKMTYHNNKITFNKCVPCKMKLNDIDISSGINSINYELKESKEYVLKYKDIVILKDILYLDSKIEMKIIPYPLRIKLNTKPYNNCEIKFKQIKEVIQLNNIESLIPIKNKGLVELDLEYAYGFECSETKWKFLL